MEKINNAAELHEAIRRLENRQAEEWSLLKEQAHELSDKLQPAAMVKRMLNNLLTPSPGRGLLGKAIGLATGFAARKAITGGSHNPLVHLLGNVIGKIVAGKAEENADGIKTIGNLLMKKLLSRLGEEKAKD